MLILGGRNCPGKTIIHNNEVEIVSKYKYLGIIFDDKLKWDDNTEEIVKKGRKLNYSVLTKRF